MAFRYFPGKDQAWLEQKLDRLNEAEAQGSAEIGGAAGDVQFQLQTQASVSATKRKVLWDLTVLAPSTYVVADTIAPRVVQGRFADP
jgi:hypothetical protein